jgi:dimethylargininase
MRTPKAKYAVVRPVPDSYDQCVRTNKEEIDVELAQKQHRDYCETLQKLSLKLIWVRGDNALPDSCFVEDTAFILGDKAVICNIKVKSRAEEVVEVAKVLETMKEVCYIKPPATIDGGDVLNIGRRVFVGLTKRTNMHAVRQLAEIVRNDGFDVTPVKVREVLHLKSACTYLGDNYVTVAEGRFDANVLKGYSKIILPKDEKYAADCLSVNGTVLVAKGHPKTVKLTRSEGFAVKELDMSEFRKGDGALTCLSILC